MSESVRERRRALVFLGVVSVLLGVVAVVSLVLPQPQATAGVTVTAVLLLIGACYGVVATSVAFVRGPRAADAEPGDADSAVE
ncbi:uncharacterized membrane protein HdeD (DUF308 family) [Leifsonia sp. EB41]|uniref:hypothetical protein n=1 Tax=Leifsonia sp. EB41 TaxID=3156260 RepID=UPI00351253B9